MKSILFCTFLSVVIANIDHVARVYGPGELAGISSGSTDDLNSIVCTQEVRCCKHNTTECYGRDPMYKCRFPKCNKREVDKEEWEKFNVTDVVHFKDKFDNDKKLKNLFLKDQKYKDYSQDERKNVKKIFCREHRGEKINVNKTDEDELSFADGGIKFLKKWKNIEKQNSELPNLDFKLIDDPEHENDRIKVGKTDMFYFEDIAEFEFDNKNYSVKTEKKSSPIYHRTTFKNIDSREECTVEGDEKTGCAIESDKNKFEMLFAGSGGASVSHRHCLNEIGAIHVTIGIGEVNGVAGQSVYLFDGEPYIQDEAQGLTVGTYVFDTSALTTHPFIIDQLTDSNGDNIFNFTCSNPVLASTKPGTISETVWNAAMDVNGSVFGCVGTYTVQVLSDDFVSAKYWCTTNGAMGGLTTANEGTLRYDDSCVADVAEVGSVVDVVEEDDDDNTALIIGAVVGGVVLIGLGLVVLQYSGLVSIVSRFDPVVNSHMLNL